MNSRPPVPAAYAVQSGFALVSPLLALLVATAITGAAAWMLRVLDRPDALMLIDARVQRLEYTVAQADRAAISLTDVWLPGDNGTRRCVTGVLEPQLGNLVTYDLIDASAIIDVARDGADRGPRLRTASGTEQLGDEARVVLGKLNRCADGDTDPSATKRPYRLPVHGSAVLGRRSPTREVGTDPDTYSEGLLLDGTVNVFGRGIRDPKRLYPAGDFDLAGATVLRTPIGAAANGLYGRALFEPASLQTGDFDGFSVQGSAITPLLHLQRSTLTDIEVPDQERIEAALLASLFRDPALLFVQAVLAIFFTTAHFIFALVGLRGDT